MHCRNRWRFEPPLIAAVLPILVPRPQSPFHWSATAGFVGFEMTMMRESLGTLSFSNSNLFPASSGAPVVKPVMLPPGRARLSTSPLATGSLIAKKTIGIVLLAFLAAKTPGKEALVTMRSTFKRTRSAARSGSRSSSRRHNGTQSQCSFLQCSPVRAALAGTP